MIDELQISLNMKTEEVIVLEERIKPLEAAVIFLA